MQHDINFNSEPLRYQPSSADKLANTSSSFAKSMIKPSVDDKDLLEAQHSAIPGNVARKQVPNLVIELSCRDWLRGSCDCLKTMLGAAIVVSIFLSAFWGVVIGTPALVYSKATGTDFGDSAVVIGLSVAGLAIGLGAIALLAQVLRSVIKDFAERCL